jgi:hypothetical protein
MTCTPLCRHSRGGKLSALLLGNNNGTGTAFMSALARRPPQGGLLGADPEPLVPVNTKLGTAVLIDPVCVRHGGGCCAHAGLPGPWLGKGRRKMHSLAALYASVGSPRRAQVLAVSIRGECFGGSTQLACQCLVPWNLAGSHCSHYQVDNTAFSPPSDDYPSGVQAVEGQTAAVVGA